MTAAGAAGPGSGWQDSVDGRPVAPFEIADSRDLALLALETRQGSRLAAAPVPPRPALPGGDPAVPDPLAHLKGEATRRTTPAGLVRLADRLRLVPRKSWLTGAAAVAAVLAVALAPAMEFSGRPVVRNSPAPVRDTTSTTTARVVRPPITTTTAFTYEPSSTSTAPSAPPPSEPVAPAPPASAGPTRNSPPAAESTPTTARPAPRRTSTTRRPTTTTTQSPPPEDPGYSDPPPYP